MLGVLVLQQIGFPEELDAEVGLALSMEMVRSPWFQYAAGASAFPLLGAVGAICLWRWALWLYCIFLVACIGVCLTHTRRPARKQGHHGVRDCAGFRTYLVFVASLKEGLEPRNPLLRDMVLLSAAVFLQVWLIRTASRLAVAAAGPRGGHDAPRRRRSTEPRRAASTRSSRLSSY